MNGASRPACKQLLASWEVRDHPWCLLQVCGKVWSPLNNSRIRKPWVSTPMGLPKVFFFRQIVSFHLVLVVHGFSLKICMSDVCSHTVLLLCSYQMKESLYAENSLVSTVFQNQIFGCSSLMSTGHVLLQVNSKNIIHLLKKINS